MENHQIIHVVSEVVLFAGLVFWISKKNSNLTNTIDDLTQRIQEQEEQLKRHEELIKQLITNINNLVPHHPPHHHKKVVHKKPPVKTRITKEIVVPPPQSDSEHESDLDNELTDEIKELQESETDPS